ncbi:MAG TPA: hypothetical protein VFX89_06300 [Gammaproteobacteria bacterium]|nr:hypothetical protein [Gammaproteobacteria bacterium]
MSFPNNEYPVYNGFAVSWADLEAKISPDGGDLFSIDDIAAFHTGRTVEVGEQRGRTGGRVKKHTLGAGSQEASVTFYRDGYQKFLRKLAALAPMRGNQAVLTAVVFTIDFKHTPLNDDEIYQRIVRGCRVIGDTIDGAEGTDADQIEVPLLCKEIVDMIDGKEVVLI